VRAGRLDKSSRHRESNTESSQRRAAPRERQPKLREETPKEGEQGGRNLCAMPPRRVCFILSNARRNAAAAWVRGMDGDLLRRALTAYFRSGGGEMPSRESGAVVLKGLKYVRLANVNGLIAVYRVDTIGRVKRLNRPPQELA
jgi:hypothetical protein